jgi:putative methyltransferase (TIGR04325 family)
VLLAQPKLRGMGRDAAPVVTDGRLRRVAKDLTPPILVRAVRRSARAAGRQPPEWEHVPEGWARATSELRGWEDDSVLDAYLTKLAEFRAASEGTAPLAHGTSAASGVGAGTVVDQNTTLAFAYALLRAARGRTRVSVLDWGGGLGFHAFVARSVLPADVELDYHCRELPRLCRLGRREVPEVTFWDDDGVLARTYDLVVASSSLQYSEDWETDLAGLAGATASHLFLSRVPVVFRHPPFVVLQRTRGHRFDTEYLSWVFNRESLLASVTANGLVLEREFLLGPGSCAVGAPEPDETRAYLFRAGA